MKITQEDALIPRRPRKSLHVGNAYVRTMPAEWGFADIKLQVACIGIGKIRSLGL
jgi:hypothetical protein